MRVARSSVWTLLVLFGAMLALPTLAWAEDEPSTPAKAADEKPGKLSLEEFSELIADSRLRAAIGAFAKILPLLFGLAFLILLYLRYDRIRSGAVPKPTSNSPPELFEPGIAMALSIAAMAILPWMVGSAFVSVQGGGALDQLDKIIVMAIATIPVGAIVLWRRHTMPGHHAPPLSRGIGLGLWAYCVAQTFIIPITLVTFWAMKSSGSSPQVQDLVWETATSSDQVTPWAIFLYGFLIAPLVEECVFRGLLYPMLRNLMGGGRGAKIGSALAVSLLFAAVHYSLTAFFALFALAMVLTYVYEKTNSLLAIIIAHSVNNFFSLIMIMLYRAGV